MLKSVIGLHLFLIHVSDVAQNMLFYCRLYADNNLIQYADKNIRNIENVLNYGLKILVG